MTENPWFKKKVSWVILLTVAVLSIALSSVTTFAIIWQFLAIKTANSDLSDSKQILQKIPKTIAALGRIEPQGEVIELSAPAFMESARVDELLVKLGDQVKAQQIIAILDSHERLQAALVLAKTDVEIAEANLEKVKAGAKVGTIQAQMATVARLQAELQGQIKTQQATIDRFVAELENAQRDCQRHQTLYQDGAISASERDNICLKEKTFQEQLAESLANRDRIVITLRKQLIEAKATLNEIEEVRSVDVMIAEAELKKAKANVQQAKANLDLAYVRAPQDGQILKIHTFPGEIVKDKGIVDLGNTRNMYVVAEVYETEISRVSIGQRATIKSMGIAQELKGTVEEIGLTIGKKDVLGTDPTSDVDVRVVEVKIILDPDSNQIVQNLTNLQVNVVINGES